MRLEIKKPMVLNHWNSGRIEFQISGIHLYLLKERTLWPSSKLEVFFFSLSRYFYSLLTWIILILKRTIFWKCVFGMGAETKLKTKILLINPFQNYFIIIKIISLTLNIGPYFSDIQATETHWFRLSWLVIYNLLLVCLYVHPDVMQQHQLESNCNCASTREATMTHRTDTHTHTHILINVSQCKMTHLLTSSLLQW